MGSDHRLGAVGAHLFVASIVQQDDAASANSPGDVTFDYFGWGCVPIVGCDIPHDWLQPKLAGHAENGGAASAGGRTEEVGRLAHGILECGTAFGELLPDFCFAFEGQQGMREGVVADDVARAFNFADNFRTLLDVASDQEKCCLNLVIGEDVEQSHRVRIVGAVVIGEGYLTGSALEAREGLSVPLSSWCHALVTGSYHGRDGDCAGYGESEHVGIVNGRPVDWAAELHSAGMAEGSCRYMS